MLNLEYVESIKRIYIKNNNEEFSILPKCLFETNGIITVNSIYDNDFFNFNGLFLKGFRYITLILNDKMKEHDIFCKTIKELYNKIKEYIKNKEILNEYEIINPLFQEDDGILKINLIIKDFNNENTEIFYNEYNNLINIRDLENKKFLVYPFITIPQIYINTTNKKCYINMYIEEAFVHIKTNTTKKINFEEYKTYLNNYKQ